jgi:serine protease Do
MHDICKTNNPVKGYKDMNLLQRWINRKLDRTEEKFNTKKTDMKAKYLFGALVMAALGAFIGVYAYTRLNDSKGISVNNASAVVQQNTDQQAKALLTSFEQGGAGQVDFTFAAEQTVHAVVHVKTTTVVENRYNPSIWDFFNGANPRQQPDKMTGWGSGVIISPDGFIITNNHVIEDAQEVSVTLNDNREFKAKVIGRDPNSDIALIKIQGDNFPVIKYGDSDNLKLGEWVLAVGNPFNLTSTVTAGIVSAKGRSLGINSGAYPIESFIQTDAVLNMGNSGGALVNTSGLLVGITSAILSGTGTYAGNSFAIPVNIVKKVVEDLKQFGEVQRAILGVEIGEVTSDIADKENLKEVKGAIIVKVNDNGAADEAGLKANDVIVGLNGNPVRSRAELQEQVGKFRPGDKTQITYIRGGKESTVPITLKNVNNNTNVVKAGEGGGTYFGATLENLSQSDMHDYRIDYGVRVTEAGEGRFRDLGIRKGYIILTINGKKVNSPTDIREFTNNEQSLTSIEGIQSNGTYFSYQFRR